MTYDQVRIITIVVNTLLIGGGLAYLFLCN